MDDFPVVSADTLILPCLPTGAQPLFTLASVLGPLGGCGGIRSFGNSIATFIDTCLDPCHTCATTR
jgi:hypothetical protein